MKPSEKRALDAEKRAQREAEQREKLLEAKSKRQESLAERRTEEESERVNTSADYKKLPEEEIEVQGDGYHRESFFGRNVKFITFIVCMALILTVLGPWGVDMLVEKSRAQYVNDEIVNKLDLSVSGLELLADMGSTLSWDDLANLNCTVFEDSKDIVKEYPIKDTYLTLRVEGTSSSKYPEIVRLIHYDSGEYVNDIRKQSIDKIIAKYGPTSNNNN